MNEIIVPVGVYAVSHNPSILTSIGLGSCVGIVIYAPKKRLGALAHAMLPWYNEGRDKNRPAKYVDTSIYLMVDELLKKGVKKREMTAKIVGGACMFSFAGSGTMDIGKKNIKAAKETLKKEGIRLVAEDVGGTHGRTMYFDLRTGEVQIHTSGKETEVL